MSRYDQAEQKPLSELIRTRKGYYVTKIGKAFDAVYQRGNLEQIDQFEQAVSALSEKALEENLEEIVTEVASKQKKVDRRPRLNYYQYAKSRNAGMTNEEIKAAFRMDSNYQICGFAGQYAKFYKKQKTTSRKKK